MFSKLVFALLSLSTMLPAAISIPANADCDPSTSSSSSSGYETTIAGLPFPSSIASSASIHPTSFPGTVSSSGYDTAIAGLPFSSRVVSNGSIHPTALPGTVSSPISQTPPHISNGISFSVVTPIPSITSTLTGIPAPATTNHAVDPTQPPGTSSSSTGNPNPTGTVNQGCPASGSCPSSRTYCCDEVHDTHTAHANGLLGGLIGINVGSIVGQVGVRCTSIGLVNLSGNACSQQMVCCDRNSFHGAVVLGCDPINLNL
ncbi:hypothetical protein BDN72DRAFT_846646 [Pluteus cervinus]|uniref:Uncharacterized protein n=1 Tax=Pluteus cervinus TaxID=181527 RepID=A0ACD3AET2_9AGAR|nr:hypothetical protein BDN72DRAFT_846646 [Pluteus cervinus]